MSKRTGKVRRRVARSRARAVGSRLVRAAGRRWPSRRKAPHPTSPHLCLLRAPSAPSQTRPMGREFRVATYNVHRWTGINGRRRPDPARAGFVISELGADVIALQEAMRPHGGDDPLEALAEALGLYVAFAATRVHKRGEIGNAILSRWPIAAVSMLDLSFSRLESRVAIHAQFQRADGVLDVVATHLALGDRTRHRQVRSLLDHPHFQEGPTLLLGDMNAWRRCAATRALEGELRGEHHNAEWPASFPAARPVLALDRIYSRGVRMFEIEAHSTPAARRASDHLPVVARVELLR